MHHHFSRAFALWVVISVAITGCFAFTFAAMQQNYRQSLNDPQIQMAEDAVAAITSGKEIDQVVPIGTVDISSSLAPWMAVYNATGVPLLSSGELNGAPPQLPPGVFATSTWTGLFIGHHLNTAPPDEDHFTWQPSPAVRQAVVLIYFNSPNGIGYVAAGRNMWEGEDHIRVLTEGGAILWGGTELATLLAIVTVIALGWL
jgi:hypothetical protein